MCRVKHVKKNTFSQENVSVIFFRYKIPKHSLPLPSTAIIAPAPAAIPAAPGSSLSP